jgi:hypothetical protein
VVIVGGCVIVLVEDPFETVETLAPQRFELHEQMLRPAYGVDVAANQLLAPAPSFDDEIGALEDRNVLLDGGEAHVVATSERRHRRVLTHRAPHDVASGAIGQRSEHPVDLLIDSFSMIYNHMVTR